MLLFGITGGIGSGKSVVCDLLRGKGTPVLSADVIAKQLTVRLPEIRQGLTEKFGAEIYDSNGNLNKNRLRELVFSDPGTRAEIDKIIHPHVLSHIRSESVRLSAEGHDFTGVEAALIFEAEMDKMLDRVVVVNAPLETRIARITERDHLVRKEVVIRIQAQMPDSEKIRRADFVVENNGGLDALASAVDRLYAWLLAEGELMGHK